MKRYKLLWLTGLFLWFCSSCGNFLSEYSQNLSYIETASDLEELLLGSGYQEPINIIVPGPQLATLAKKKDFMSYIHLLDDDVKEAPAPPRMQRSTDKPWQEMSGYYRWADDPNVTISQTSISDPVWPDFYERIAVLNAIIGQIPEQRKKNKSEDEILNQVGGET